MHTKNTSFPIASTLYSPYQKGNCDCTHVLLRKDMVCMVEMNLHQPLEPYACHICWAASGSKEYILFSSIMLHCFWNGIFLEFAASENFQIVLGSVHFRPQSNFEQEQQGHFPYVRNPAFSSGLLFWEQPKVSARVKDSQLGIFFHLLLLNLVPGSY